MKKSYLSPEFDIVKIVLGTDICSSPPSAETPIDDVIIIDDDDDLF